MEQDAGLRTLDLQGASIERAGDGSNIHRILGISGSLRAASVHSSVLRAMARLAPPAATLSVFGGIGELPLFNPDLEGHEPASVFALRAALQASDALIIASPEYAHGVTGVIKNALDWLVSGCELEHKPVALLTAFERSTYAPPALRETLVTMGADVIDAASLTVALATNRLDEHQILADAGVVEVLRRVLSTMTQVLETRAVKL